MTPIRWFSKRTHATAAEVQAHAQTKGVVFAQAKHELEKRTKPVLQYFDEATKEWRAVPSVEHVLDPKTGVVHVTTTAP